MHNPAAFDNAFRIPTIHLSALPMLVHHYLHHAAPGPALTVVSPDVGGIKRAQLFREQLAAQAGGEVGLAFVEKRRARGIVSGGTLAGEIAGRTAIVLDDLCATGGTLIRAAAACRAGGATSVQVAVTHTPLVAGVSALVAAESISHITVTDSVGALLPSALLRAADSRLSLLPVAPLFGQTLRRMLTAEPVAPLLERWPA